MNAEKSYMLLIITARMIQVADLLNSKQPFVRIESDGKKILPSEVHLDCGHLIITIFLKSHCIMVFFFFFGVNIPELVEI